MLRDLSRSACRRRARDAVDRNGCADIAAREPNAPVVGSGWGATVCFCSEQCDYVCRSRYPSPMLSTHVL